MNKTTKSKQIRKMHYELKIMFGYKKSAPIEKYPGKRIDRRCYKFKDKADFDIMQIRHKR